MGELVGVQGDPAGDAGGAPGSVGLLAAGAEGRGGGRAALGEEPRGGSPGRARLVGFSLLRLFLMLLSRFAPHGGNNLKMSIKDNRCFNETVGPF